MGERGLCKPEVVGSIPIVSTTYVQRVGPFGPAFCCICTQPSRPKVDTLPHVGIYVSR